MATIDFSSTADFYPSRNEFLPIGTPYSELTESDKLMLDLKIAKSLQEKPEKTWATLGWKRKGKKFRPKGRLHFSKYGHDDSHGPTKEIIEVLHAAKPLDEGHKFVLERYIDLTDVDFEEAGKDAKDIDELPMLRLTVFVEEDEGAVVYLDYGSKSKDEQPDYGTDFIPPQPTDKNFSFKRDRLNYHIPLLQKEHREKLAEADPSKPGEAARFVAKVLTYKRKKDSTPKKWIQEGLKYVANESVQAGAELVLGKTYGLHKFHYHKNTFSLVDANNPIEPDAKTLLLVHGTFVDHTKSFAGTFGTEKKRVNGADTVVTNTFLQGLIDSNKFQQIIAFDHSTVFDDSAENLNQLRALLAEALGQARFTQPVSLLGTSRGGVVCYDIAASRNMPFTVDKVATVSAAFGVGYLSKAARAFRLMKAMRVLTGATIPLVVQLAQMSGEWLIKQPGLAQIKPDDKRLTRVMNASPASLATIYYNIRTDWDASVPNPERPLLRGVKSFVDFLIKPILGKTHDWVVGYEKQMWLKQNDLPHGHIDNVHTKVMNPASQSHPLLMDFF
jgi:hypothetical protein